MIPRAEVLNLVEGLMRRPARWVGEPEEQWGLWHAKPGAYAELTISAYRTYGQDEYRQTYDEVKDQLSSTMTGLRGFTVSVKVRSFELGQAPFDLLERLRLGLRTKSARYALETAGIALVDIQPIIPLPNETVDNREAFVAVMDVRLAFAVNQDTSDDEGGTIKKVDNGGVIPGTVTS